MPKLFNVLFSNEVSAENATSRLCDGPAFNALHLPGWEITGYPRLDRSSDPLLFSASPEKAARAAVCRKCPDGGFPKRHGTALSTIVDIPAFGRHVRIRVERTRFRCGCGWTGYAEVPDIDARYRMTARCAVYVIERSALHPFSDVAREVGISETTVRTLTMAAWKAVPDYEFETPRYLGIDELILKDSADKGRPGPRPRAVFVDLETGRVLDILASNTKLAVSRWLLRLPNRHRIRIVTTDLEPTYREIVKAILPDAKLVVDKWHAMKGIWDALDGVRVATLRETGQTVFNDAATLQMRNMLRAREIKPTDSRWLLFDGFLKQHPDIALAYAVKTEFCLIWERAETMAMALMQFLIWSGKIPNLPPQILKYMAPVEEQLTRNRNDLLTYFGFPLTNAPTEAMNRIIRRISGAGQGLNLAALRYRVRAYSRAKRVRNFICDCCLRRMSNRDVFHEDMYVNRENYLIYSSEGHRLCHPCRDNTFFGSFDREVNGMRRMPEAPRIASAEDVKGIGQARRRTRRPKPPHPDLFG